MDLPHVIVTASSQNILVQGIANAVGARDDMVLATADIIPIALVLNQLARIPETQSCAVIRVGSGADDVVSFTNSWLALRGDLVLLHVNIDVGDDGAAFRFERHTAHDAPLDSMLSALRELMSGTGRGAQILHFVLRAVTCATLPETTPNAEPDVPGPVLISAIEWIHALLGAAVRNQRKPISIASTSDAEDSRDWVGFGVNAATVLRAMTMRGVLQEVVGDPQAADAANTLAQRIRDSETDAVSLEPLAYLGSRLDLTPLELQMFLLTLAPELDARYQRCMAVLLDDASRRVGTLGLYAELLGEPVSVMRQLIASGGLARWRLLQHAGTLPHADDSLHVDSSMCAWLLGDTLALDTDPHLQRLMRTVSWPGADLFATRDEPRASALIDELQASRASHCTLFESKSPAYAMALIEYGAKLRQVLPLRVEMQHLAELDLADVADAALRLGRAALLTDRPLLLDASTCSAFDEKSSLALATLDGIKCRYGVVSADVSGIARALGTTPFRILTIPQGKAERVDLVRNALARVGTLPDNTTAEFIATNFPLQIDGFDAALRLAQSQHANASFGKEGDDDKSYPQARHIAARERFISGCKAIAMQGISQLAERIEPGFDINDIVLPKECADQLHEIVCSVRFAPMVLDQWDFQRQLPYGRGTTVLFHGPSGTGKTMAAHGIAKALNVHVLRLDLSRVVSKYIGETEKHCDQVFSDATNSGAAILIDEADALFGKRSEVKDAHDRYANIEVAFLLQRIESFDGLAILTTNLRQNLDPAFLRRLRFIIEFPRPDVQARAAIWQACLPKGAHCVSPHEVGELARRIDLTGGHIRQITLRAAFLAASRGSLIEVTDLVAATRSELAKLGISAAGLGAVVAPARRVA